MHHKDIEKITINIADIQKLEARLKPCIVKTVLIVKANKDKLV